MVGRAPQKMEVKLPEKTRNNGKMNRSTDQRKHQFFSPKGRWHPSREKAGNWGKKNQGKTALLLALVSPKLSDAHQRQLCLCFGHQEMGFKERVPDIFASNQALPRSLAYRRSPTTQFGQCFLNPRGLKLCVPLFRFCILNPSCRATVPPSQAVSLGKQQRYNRLLQKLSLKKNQCQQTISSREIAEAPEVSAALHCELGRSLVTINRTGC